MLAELLSDLRYRIRALFNRGAMEQELDQELRFHLEREAEKHVRAGCSPEEAMRRAGADFGGVEVTKEASRDGRGLSWLETMIQDIRYALRSLRRSPVFTIGIMLTLALGIGANAVMFGIVDQLLFRAPAYMSEPETVHRVYLVWNYRGDESAEAAFEYIRYLDIKKFTQSFSDYAAFSTRPLAVGTGPEAREMEVGTLSASVFDLFEAKPVLGRFFVAQEDTIPVGAQVVVLSYGYWQSHYGGRPDVLGQQLQVGTVSYTIIGVAPRDFVSIADNETPAVFIPITTYAGTVAGGKKVPGYYQGYNWGWMSVVVRRKPGVTVEQASADLSQAFERSWNIQVERNPGMTPASVAKPHAIAGPIQYERGPRASSLSRVARWVWGIAAVVLLIACANVANLMLARTVRRRREIALRLALGVSRARLVGQLLTESLLLATGGGIAALLLAHWGGLVLRGLFLPKYLGEGNLADGRTLLFAFVATLVAGLVTGLAPVLQARRSDLAECLKAGARDSGARQSKTRTGLLLLQSSLSVVLLVGAGLFVRSVQNIRGIRLGYDVDPVLYVYPTTRGAKLDDAAKALLMQQLREVGQRIPGVQSASLGMTVPFWDTWTTDLFVSGIDSVEKLGDFTLQSVSPEYFATVGTRVLLGRGFTEDDRENSPRVMLVSESMGKRLWPDRSPIGQCIKVDADTMPCTTVVGITEDIHQRSVTKDKGYSYYLPVRQFHPESAVLFIRARGNADDLKETVRRQLQAGMPGDGYVTVSTMKEIIGPQVRSWELGATMFLAFGGLALVLAAIGLYSVIAYDVAQRTRELGIRIALGARVDDVVRLVTRDGMRFALVGVALGGVISFVAGRWIASLLYAVSPRDPMVFGVVAGVLLAVAALASALPAFRATRVDPSVTLRTE